MSDWPYFPEIPEGMNEEFMDRLISLRSELGFPLPVTSSLRDDDRHSMHNLGRAVDVGVWGERAFKLVSAAPKFGMVGIGIKQHGPHNKRFIHVDDGLHVNGFPRPMIWSYK